MREDVEKCRRTSCSLPCPLLIAVCGSLLCSAPAAADPVYNDGSAESVVNDLKAQGYTVVINWLTGYNTKSLSVC